MVSPFNAQASTCFFPKPSHALVAVPGTQSLNAGGQPFQGVSPLLRLRNTFHATGGLSARLPPGPGAAEGTRFMREPSVGLWFCSCPRPRRSEGSLKVGIRLNSRHPPPAWSAGLPRKLSLLSASPGALQGGAAQTSEWGSGGKRGRHRWQTAVEWRIQRPGSRSRQRSGRAERRTAREGL